MKKKFIFLMLMIATLSLMARENPFETVEYSKTTGKATYKKDTRENFTQSKVMLPSSARILKSVELHYQNLDGSIKSQTVAIDKKIDWHDELILKKTKDIDSYTPIEIEIPTNKIKEQKKVINFKDIVSFEIDSNSLLVKTNDKKIRNFLVTNPYKIVIDFEKEISFYSKIYELKTKKFRKIAIGKHEGYYRVVIELDGQYLYNLEKVDEGYIVTLK